VKNFHFFFFFFFFSNPERERRKEGEGNRLELTSPPSFVLSPSIVPPPLPPSGISTILSCQHPSGGFGGNVSHLPHLLTTYASVCSLAILGGGWDKIDRQAIYSFFMRMKRQDGGFSVCEGGEVDVRYVGSTCLSFEALKLILWEFFLVRGRKGSLLPSRDSYLVESSHA